MKKASFNCDVVQGQDGVIRSLLSELFGGEIVNGISTTIAHAEPDQSPIQVTITCAPSVMSAITAIYTPLSPPIDTD